MMVHVVTPPLLPVRDTALSAPQEVVIDEVCSVLGISRCNLDVQASFVGLGGHSLSAVQLASRCRKRGTRLSVGRILVSKSLSELVELSETGPAASEVVIGQLDSFEKRNASPIPNIMEATPGNEWLDGPDITAFSSPIDAQEKQWQQKVVKPHHRRNSRIASTDQLPQAAPKVTLPPRPLSAAPSSLPAVPVASELQLSLIHGSIKNPGTNIIQHFETYHPQDIPRMKEAWRRVFELEPILSTRYQVGYSYSPNLNREPHDDDDDDDDDYDNDRDGSHFDWTEICVHEPTRFDQLVGEKPTVASVVCSFKVITLVNSQGDKVKSTIIWTIHHALIDGYSAGLVFAKVQRASAGKPITPGPSFARLSAGLKHLRSTRKAEGDAFWHRQQQTYSKAANALQLPVPLEPDRGTSEHIIHLAVTPKKLAKLAQRYEATPAALFYTAWTLVLSLYADCDHLVFGMVLSGRNLPLAGIEDTVGPFVNTLPLVVSLDRASSVRDLVAHVFQRMNDLAQYQWTNPENGYSRHFQSALAMQFGFESTEENAAAPIEPPYSKQSTDVPLSLAIQPNGSVSIMYFNNQFNRRDIERIGELYSQAIYSLFNFTATVGSYRASVMTLDMYRLLRAYGNTNCGLTIASAVDQDLVTLFEQNAKAGMDRPALERGLTRLTYGELNQLANVVANTLSAHIKPNEIVCVDADRSPNWIIAIFGILKAGGVYCPLDTVLPDQLRSSMFEMTKANVFLAPTAEGVARAPCTAQLTLVVQDILSARDVQGVTFPSRSIANPSADAYVCFTSGSTGTPKGVLCSHEGLVAFQRDLEVRLFAQPGVKVSQLMSVAFDGSIHEIFSALCHGATLVLQNGPNPFEILGAVDSAILTPSVAQALDPHDFPNLKNVYLVGEPVKQTIADLWGATKNLYNMYGPTEGTGGATIKRLLPNCPVTIGTPNPSTRIYILSSKRELLPPGMIGEIYIAGVQVARGYLGLPETTKERFLPDTICRGLGELMYKTGDRAYWNEAGELVCLGRTDRQIKLRGFRLDMNDLEIRVSKAVAGLNSVAFAPKDDFLVAVVQPSSLDLTSVRSQIAKVLPVHARPRHIVLVDKFPMTAAGKLDYKAITSDQYMRISEGNDYLDTTTETKVSAIWRKLLKLDRNQHLSPKSNFLELGGHSLLQMTLAARLASTFQTKIPPRVVIDAISLRDLASELDRLRSYAAPRCLSKPLGTHGLSPTELEWYGKYRSNPNSSAFNVSFVAELSTGLIDRNRLTKAWNTVLNRHAIFRGRYISCRGFRVERRYADSVPRVQRVQELDIRAEVNRPFDLASSSPIRVFLSTKVLVVVMNHIVADLTTLQILLSEVQALYTDEQLRPVEHTYEDSAVWADEPPECDLNFWTSYLADLPPMEVGHGGLRKRSGYRGTSQVYELPEDLASKMLAFSLAKNVSLQQLAMAAVALALQSASTTTDIVLGSPFINRSTEADLETVGLFLQPLPIRIKYDQSDYKASRQSFLQRVQESSQAALGHAVLWQKLLEQLNVPQDHFNNPLFDVMVTFHDSERAVKLDLPGLLPCLTWSEGSKFPLMAEFSALKTGKIILRVEADDELYPADSIDDIVADISKAFQMLVLESPYPAMKASITQAGVERRVFPLLRKDAFGARLDEL